MPDLPLPEDQLRAVVEDDEAGPGFVAWLHESARRREESKR